MCALCGCAGLPVLVFSSSSLPLLLSWLLPSLPGVGLSRSGLRFHSWCHAFLLHSWVHSVVSQVFYLSLQCKHIHSLCMVLHRWHLSSSCLLWAASLALGHSWGYPLTYRLSLLLVIGTLSRSSCWVLGHTEVVGVWRLAGWFVRSW